MPLVARKFQSLDALNVFLQGGIEVGSQLNLVNGKVHGLHGLTLVFTTPAGTVTFADADGLGLSLLDIITQINDDVATLKARSINDGGQQRLVIIEVSPTGGVVLDGATSTANQVFGFSESTVTGTFYNPPDGVAPRLIATESSPGNDSTVVIVEEA